jgi:amino acid adenylation domain-containing protein
LHWTLLRLADDEALLLQVAHHLAFDAWALRRLWEEVGEIYSATKQDRAPDLPPPGLQYPDYARQQRLRTPSLVERSCEWVTRLRPPPALLELPGARPRPTRQTFAGAELTVRVPDQLHAGLRRLRADAGVSMFTTLMSGFLALLHRYTGRTDLCIGAMTANRTDPATHFMIGTVANPVPVRVDVDGDISFSDLLGRVHRIAAAAYSHQDLPFDEVVRLVDPPRDRRYNPLVQLVMSRFDTARLPLNWPGVRGEYARLGNGTAKFDLDLVVVPEAAGTLQLQWEYNTDLFEERAIRAMADHLLTLLQHASTRPDTALADLPLMTEVERELILTTWSSGRPPPPPDSCVHTLVSAAAARSPDATAVSADDALISYCTLEDRANRLARLLASHGVRTETPVVLLLPRSADFVISALAVLKAGGCYVPVDPHYPPERIQAMLAHVGSPVLITRSGTARPGHNPARQTIVLDHPDTRSELDKCGGHTPEVTTEPHQLAYIMFTSGSTGGPKAVEIPHRAIARLVQGAADLELAGEVFLHAASPSFDASTFEIWAALTNAAKLVIAPDTPGWMDQIGDLVRREGVTALLLSTGVFCVLVDHYLSELNGVRQLLTGGEAMPPSRLRAVQQHLPDCRVMNVYGPTEATTMVSRYTPPLDWDGGPTVPIGRPIPGDVIRILDKRMRLVPAGVAGELYLGGAGLARGYHGNPRLTATRFVPDPFATEPGARLYATGDLARYLPDGEIDFLGRVDRQVKIRGVRVEPGEVEEALRGHAAVQDVAVVPYGDQPDDRRLAAYLVFGSHQHGAAEVRAVRGWLRDRVPGPLVPDLWHQLARLPLTPNGKLDRKALPAPVALSGEPSSLPAATDRYVDLVAKIWADALGVPEVPPDADFFELGGHSLLATRIVSRLRDQLRIEVPLTAVFDHPTVSEFAAHLPGDGQR